MRLRIAASIRGSRSANASRERRDSLKKRLLTTRNSTRQVLLSEETTPSPQPVMLIAMRRVPSS
jgi:hypothetical protein